jgi:circadian clock protein KaiC
MNENMEMVNRASSGVAGLDEVLHGGYIAGRTYLLSGPPGTGKTTIGWHFLTAGRSAGERTMFITFGEPVEVLKANAISVGFDPAGVSFLDLSPQSGIFAENKSYDLFTAAEVELEPTTERIIEAVEKEKPSRVFVDSMTHLRYLARDGHEFRRLSLSFSRYLADKGATVLLSSEATPNAPDDDLRFLSDGVLELASDPKRRRLHVTKFRGSAYRSGVHTLLLDREGAKVFPRLIPEEHGKGFDPAPLASGVPELDELLHGGLERGTITLFTGPSGVGKTTLGLQFMKEAAARGHRSVVYTFDERTEILIQRCQSVNIPVVEMIGRGTLSVVALEALRYGADEFAHLVRRDVEERGTKIVMIDSISGYRLSVADDDLTERLHALCKYLQNVGVTVLLVNEVQDLSRFRISEVGISYLADNVVFIRFIERRVEDRIEIQRAVGVLKKRLSDFEKTLREFRITSRGVKIGPPLQQLTGGLGNLTGGVEVA